MLRVKDRRRHARTEVVCPATLRDKRGRIIFRGRSADLSPAGVKVVGPPPAALSVGMDVWLEMKAPNPSSSGPRRRCIKVPGYVRRVTDIGDWKSVIVIIVENEIPSDVLHGER
ncbi:MAG: PilZ domain-containing protein [Phycisphaerae bacterium]